EKLAGVARLRLPVRNVRKPRHLCIATRVALACVALTANARLVLPVRGDTELRALVHLGRTNLNLDRAPARTNDSGVKRLVEVELGRRDVVLESTRDRVPSRVNRSERRVAVAHRVHDDTNADEIVDVVELATALHHFLVDRV